MFNSLENFKIQNFLFIKLIQSKWSQYLSSEKKNHNPCEYV